MSETLVIFRKELKEILRDRKTLIFMLAVPIFLMPLLLDVGIQFALSSAKKAASETLRYAVVGEQYLPDLATRFGQDKSFERVTPETWGDHRAGGEVIAQAITDDVIDVAIVIGCRKNAASESPKAKPREAALLAMTLLE